MPYAVISLAFIPHSDHEHSFLLCTKALRSMICLGALQLQNQTRHDLAVLTGIAAS